MKSEFVVAVALICFGQEIFAASDGPTVVVKGRPPQQTIRPSLPEIEAARATAIASSPTSDVKGLAFDRIVQIWLENTNYVAASGDSNFQWLASQGILLNNYFAVTHPSQPNYAAVAAGDHFGMDSGDFIRVPENISTVVDLLDTKGISWAAYQENMPHAGFQGFNFSNQRTFANDYVRKHNPLVQFDSIANNATRASQVKNFTSFGIDLAGRRLPQWVFMTPNMTNDGHDTNYRFAGQWARSFLTPLLADAYFTDRTLIVVSFDESEVYSLQNRVFTVLLGGAVPQALKGTQDPMFYTHYSTISTVSANWGLPSLGRWDCGANVLALVANRTNYTNVMPGGVGGPASSPAAVRLFFNASYPGPASNNRYTPGWWPVPDTASPCAAGNGVLGSVASTWSGLGERSLNYSDAFPYDTRSGSNTGSARAWGGKGANGAAAAGDSGDGSTQKGGSSAVSLSGAAVSLSGLVLAFIVMAWV